MQVVAINDLFDVKTNANLLKYDTSYGHFPAEVKVQDDKMIIEDWEVASLSERDPQELPWKDMGVDIVIESTGIFRTGPQAEKHRLAGAKKVLITAPAKQEDVTVVLGVNDQDYDPQKHHIISNASCTTNCLAPVCAVLHNNFGIQTGIMNTIHSYTNDQRILDLPHKDLRRARAAACNIIPTTTGAAKAVGLVLPELAGRIDGYSLRVPTPTVSVVDFTAILEKGTDTEKMRQLFKESSQGELKGILGYNTEPLVSSDFKADPRSGIIEEEFTTVHNKNIAKVMAWYDNEWGYSCRVVDLAWMVIEKGL